MYDGSNRIILKQSVELSAFPKLLIDVVQHYQAVYCYCYFVSDCAVFHNAMIGGLHIKLYRHQAARLFHCQQYSQTQSLHKNLHSLSLLPSDGLKFIDKKWKHVVNEGSRAQQQ